MSDENKLTDKEQNIVLATIRLWNVNYKDGFILDYELVENSFDISIEQMREIRDLIQEIRPRK